MSHSPNVQPGGYTRPRDGQKKHSRSQDLFRTGMVDVIVHTPRSMFHGHDYRRMSLFDADLLARIEDDETVEVRVPGSHIISLCVGRGPFRCCVAIFWATEIEVKVQEQCPVQRP